MIRFSAALVVVAIGILVAGIATSKLALVYVAIILSAVALVALAIGVVLKRDELFADAEQQVGVAAGAAAQQSALVGQPESGRGETTAYGWGANAQGWQQPGQESAPAGATGAPRRADLSQTRTDLAQTRADMTALREQPGQPGGPDLSKTRSDLTPPAETPAARKAVQPPWEPPSGASWFDRQRNAEDAASTPAEGSVPAADEPPAGSEPEAKPAPPRADDAVPAKTAAGGAAADDSRDTADASDTDTPDPETAAIDAAKAETASAETASAETADAGSPAPPKAADAPSGEHMVTVVPGVPRYHAANCILIRFMADDDLQRMTLDEAEEAGCTACRACQADTGSFKATD
ncbi:MAG TPA: hypothetical protein VG164_10095 [Trebonia sp.]|nr:hypothetical protein [Trebonia sp.]